MAIIPFMNINSSVLRSNNVTTATKFDGAGTVRKHGGGGGHFGSNTYDGNNNIDKFPSYSDHNDNADSSSIYSRKNFNMIDNYIYFYHLDKFMLLPSYPESIADSMQIDFQTSTPLARSAPIYSFAKAGPRSFNISLKLHRDLMYDINYNRSNYVLENLGSPLNDDYVDALAKEIQACALPKYDAASKTVKPPMIAIRFGNEIFCKGVVNSQLTVTYSGPLLSYNGGDKYACVEFQFSISEVDPYSAEMVVVNGSFRGLSSTLEKGLFRTTDYTGAGNRATDSIPRCI